MTKRRQTLLTTGKPGLALDLCDDIGTTTDNTHMLETLAKGIYSPCVPSNRSISTDSSTACQSTLPRAYTDS